MSNWLQGDETWRRSMKALLILSFLGCLVCGVAEAGCKSDYQDAIESCHFLYDEPNEADDLALCIQDAQDEYQSCVND
jgi:hypothetical protein